jgi:hypothetical protein
MASGFNPNGVANKFRKRSFPMEGSSCGDEKRIPIITRLVLPTHDCGKG